MDFCRNISVSGGLHSDYHQPEQQPVSPSCSKIDGSLDDLFSGHPLEEGDVNLEWLSIFVEDCLSSSGSVNFPPPAATSPTPQITTCDATNSVASQLVKDSTASHLLQQHKLVIPGKARSKRKRSHSNCIPGGTPFMSRRRGSCWSQAHQFFMNLPHAQDLTLTSDPPLLQQAYWLADSELIFPKKEEEEEEKDHPINYTSSGSRKEFRGDGDDLQEVVVNKQLGRKKKKKKVNDNSKLMMMGVEGRREEEVEENNNSGGIRRCSHCLSQRTPQWRGGPLGPKTLCNACGVRYKSGRLLPEYRPAKSPTFVSYMHSNSHKKVLEMRTLSHSL